jgi:glycosyltransferase involved in cell wall biosynthesis
MNKPVVSIITSTFNDKLSLLETAESINNSTYKKLEWIVIDGASSDGTLEWLNSSSTNIAQWRSEPDDGIYDAWNKGLSLAKGEWIVFLGAGDLLEPNWLARALSIDLPYYDLIYGDIELTFSGYSSSFGKKCGLAWGKAVTKLECSMCLPHPGMLHRKSLFDSNKFSTAYKIVGDWEFFIKIRRNIRAAKYCEGQIQASVPLVGVSANHQSIERHFAERMRLMRDYQIEGCWLQSVKWTAKRLIARHASLFQMIQLAMWVWRR